LKKRWTIEAHRKKISNIEVDFLARDPAGILHIVEVKSAGSWAVNVVSKKQLKRLKMASEILASREPVGLVILVVMREKIVPIRL
jgi:Holliday junction resolvase-like predicted endonuclease